MRRNLTIGACVLVSAMASAAQAEGAADNQDLANLSIEQLANIEVRSASKTDEPLSSAPASLYVITGNAILGSGVTSLPEALRLAPNLWSQQIDASNYAISARGFNGIESSNKLLVLIDGRSVYAPLASSVYWNLHWPLLEDLKQVEVISGPGGTLYGPNAVNGVINVTTRDAHDNPCNLERTKTGRANDTRPFQDSSRHEDEHFVYDATRLGRRVSKARPALQLHTRKLCRRHCPFFPQP